MIVLVHGGPVAEPADAEFVLKNTRNCHGFYGASSMERLPAEVAISEQTRKFKTISRRLNGPVATSESAKGGTDMSGAADRRN